MICFSCKREIPDDCAACPHCGKRLSFAPSITHEEVASVLEEARRVNRRKPVSDETNLPAPNLKA